MTEYDVIVAGSGGLAGMIPAEVARRRRHTHGTTIRERAAGEPPEPRIAS